MAGLSAGRGTKHPDGRQGLLMSGVCVAARMDAEDQSLYCSCPPVCRLDAPTPLLPPGFILLLIGGGCLLYPPLCRRLAGVYIAGMWPRGTRESNGRGPAATTAMWPAVWPGGRPSPGGRRATTRRIGLSVRPQRQRRPYHQPKRPATGRWRTTNRQRVDAAPAAATGSCPNGGGVSRRGRDSVRSTWRGHCRALVEGDLSPWLVSPRILCAVVSSWGDVFAARFADHRY